LVKDLEVSNDGADNTKAPPLREGAALSRCHMGAVLQEP
jgi:hypothetical protein